MSAGIRIKLNGGPHAGKAMRAADQVRPGKIIRIRDDKAPEDPLALYRVNFNGKSATYIGKAEPDKADKSASTEPSVP